MATARKGQRTQQAQKDVRAKVKGSQPEERQNPRSPTACKGEPRVRQKGERIQEGLQDVTNYPVQDEALTTSQQFRRKTGRILARRARQKNKHNSKNQRKNEWHV